MFADPNIRWWGTFVLHLVAAVLAGIAFIVLAGAVADLASAMPADAPATASAAAAGPR